MIRKYKKDTSKRLKNNYEEIKLKPKSSYMINQFFIKSQGFSRSYKIMMYKNLSEMYKIFKKDPFGNRKTIRRQEFKLISTKQPKIISVKTENELKLEKKYFNKKTLYSIKKPSLRLNISKLYEVENTLLRLLL